MKKIMFNDKYGLTKAVLDGRKTMTRRALTAIACNHIDWTAFKYGEMECYGDGVGGWYDIKCASKFQIGEVVAVAQKYKDVPNPFCGRGTDLSDALGWENKMFVRANLMPHKIRITDIKVERLQDISDEDCMKEGIRWDYVDFPLSQEKIYRYDDLKKYRGFCTPRAAFADLINKISGKGTWESNPYVFVYEFELVKEGGAE